jgi:hypothetical protein
VELGAYSRIISTQTLLDDVIAGRPTSIGARVLSSTRFLAELRTAAALLLALGVENQYATLPPDATGVVEAHLERGEESPPRHGKPAARKSWSGRSLRSRS